MDRYLMVEETRVGTVLPSSANPFVPTIITGYGKCSEEETVKVLTKNDWSPLSEVVVKLFTTNKEYNQYIRKMQELGAKIEYNKIKY